MTTSITKQRMIMKPGIQNLKNSIGKELGPEAPPLLRWLNGIIREVDEEKIAIEFIVRPEIINAVHFLDEGIQAAIMDHVIGMTIKMLGHETFHFPSNLHVDYFDKVKAGEKILAKSKIIHIGNEVINAQCELFDDYGNIIACGTSNQAIVH